MATQVTGPRKRVLDAHERIAEMLFGLIMVLTFTGTLSVVEAGRDDVRAMLIGALGCNLAWGVIDAVLYLMGCQAEKAGNLRVLHAVRRSTDPAEARRLIADALPVAVASILQPAELDSIHQRLRQLPEPPARARLGSAEWRGALGVFLLVFAATFPVAVPFLLLPEVLPAMRLSNGIAIGMLFALGHQFGRCTGRGPLATGFLMVALGGALVGLTIALGG